MFRKTRTTSNTREGVGELMVEKLELIGGMMMMMMMMMIMELGPGYVFFWLRM